MKTVGDRRFVEIPGDATHELPPLLVRGRPEVARLDKVVEMATHLVDQEDLLADAVLDLPAADVEKERRRMDLAINLVEQYLAFVDHWQWGQGILEWIRQCEITFGSSAALRQLLQPDLWPHAGRASFVRLLEDKHVPHPNVDLCEAVGLRLTFREPPPLNFFSEQFLFYLNASVGASAFQAWSARNPQPVSSLPPERFEVSVIRM